MAAGSIPCVTKLCPHLTVDFRTPGNFTARPKTSCLVALPGVLVLSFARTLPLCRFARTLPEGSGTGFGRVQLGGASPRIEVCHTELCQVFARELCQAIFEVDPHESVGSRTMSAGNYGATKLYWHLHYMIARLGKGTFSGTRLARALHLV